MKKESLAQSIDIMLKGKRACERERERKQCMSLSLRNRHCCVTLNRGTSMPSWNTYSNFLGLLKLFVYSLIRLQA